MFVVWHGGVFSCKHALFHNPFANVFAAGHQANNGRIAEATFSSHKPSFLHAYRGNLQLLL